MEPKGFQERYPDLPSSCSPSVSVAEGDSMNAAGIPEAEGKEACLRLAGALGKGGHPARPAQAAYFRSGQ